MFMNKHFVHDIHSNKSYTLLTSSFSHGGPIHFGLNMYAFSSFSNILILALGPELFCATYFFGKKWF